MFRVEVESVDPSNVPASPTGRTAEGKYAVPTERRDKVALLGFASSSKDLAPFADPSFEIWGVNEIYRSLPRLDRLFEMHTRAHLTRNRVRDAAIVDGDEHIQWMARATDVIIYMQEAWPEIPRSVEFPLALLTKAFYPGETVPYFTSTPAYMLALAIFEGFKTIGLYGIDLLSDEEYEYQRPCMEYLVGVGRGLGCSIYVPPTSALCKANFVYGFSEPPMPEQVDEVIGALTAESEKLRANLTQMEFNRHTASGAIQTLDSIVSWLKHSKRGGRVGGKVGKADEQPGALTLPDMAKPKDQGAAPVQAQE